LAFEEYKLFGFSSSLFSMSIHIVEVLGSLEATQLRLVMKCLSPHHKSPTTRLICSCMGVKGCQLPIKGPKIGVGVGSLPE